MKLFKMLLITGALAFAAACSNDDDDNTLTIAPPQLPPGIASFSPCDKGQELPLAQVPAAIADSINNLFPGWKIDKLIQYTQNGQVFYGLEIEKGIDEIDILFTDAGQLVSYGPDDDDDQQISIGSLPADVVTYIANNYPGFVLDDAEIEIEYGQSFYEVEIKGPGTDDDLKVYFDGNNVYVCEVKKSDNSGSNDDDDDSGGGNDDDDDNGSNDDDDDNGGGNDDDDDNGSNDDDDNGGGNDDDDDNGGGTGGGNDDDDDDDDGNDDDDN